MTRNQLIDRVRLYMHDRGKKIYDDDELGAMVDAACVEYSRDTLAYRKEFDFIPNDGGKYKFPSGSVAYIVGWNKDGREVVPSCTHELEKRRSDYIAAKGEPVAIYDDVCESGEFRLFPDPWERQVGEDRIVSEDPLFYGVNHTWGGEQYGVLLGEPYEGSAFGELYLAEIPQYTYGEVYDDEAEERGEDGRPSNPYGVSSSDNPASDDYGVIGIPREYEFAGDMCYARVASPDEIRDHLALIYHVMWQAYDVDGDFTDPAKAQLFRQYYEGRVALRQTDARRNGGVMTTGSFF